MVEDPESTIIIKLSPQLQKALTGAFGRDVARWAEFMQNMIDSNAEDIEDYLAGTPHFAEACSTACDVNAGCECH